MKKLRVALAQTDSHLGNVKENVLKGLEILESYRGTTDIIVFPELYLTGYDVGNRFHEYALRRENPLFLEMVEATKGTTAVFGFIEETSSLEFYNSLAVVRDRKVVHIHRKIFLPNYGIFKEKKHFKPGQNFQCFDLGDLRTASFICGDAWDPALVNLGAADQARLFIFSVCSPDTGFQAWIKPWEGWQRLTRFYSMMYGVYIIFVNRVGVEGDLKFWGGSEVVDPFGRVVVSASQGKEEIRLTELDLELVREARIALPTVRDQDLSFIGRHLNQLVEKRMK